RRCSRRSPAKASYSTSPIRRRSVRSFALPVSTPTGERSMARRRGGFLRNRWANSRDGMVEFETPALAKSGEAESPRSLIAALDAWLGSLVEAVAAALVAAEIVI